MEPNATARPAATILTIWMMSFVMFLVLVLIGRVLPPFDDGCADEDHRKRGADGRLDQAGQRIRMTLFMMFLAVDWKILAAFRRRPRR
jgi:hypothetical protein